MNEKFIKDQIYSTKIQKKSIRLSNEKKKKKTSETNNININNIFNKGTFLELNTPNLYKNSERNTHQLSNRSTKEIRKVNHYKKSSEVIPNRENIRERYNFNGTNPNYDNSFVKKKRHNLNLTNNSKHKNTSKDDNFEFDYLNENDFMNFNVKKINNIFLCYIQCIHKEYVKKIKKFQDEKMKIITKLITENKILCQENNKLKLYYY